MVKIYFFLLHNLRYANIQRAHLATGHAGHDRMPKHLSMEKKHNHGVYRYFQSPPVYLANPDCKDTLAAWQQQDPGLVSWISFCGNQTNSAYNAGTKCSPYSTLFN